MTLRKIVVWISLVGLVLLAYDLFVPKKYDVSIFEERPETKYWELNTASRIGYTHIKSDNLTEKSPIIYLHGGPGGMITDKIIEAYRPLAKLGHDLYFYDQIGSGHSARLDNIAQYTVHRHKKDLVDIIEKIGSEKVILIGQSWGAMLAIQYLEEFDSKIEKLILTSPGPILPINQNLDPVKPPDSLHFRSPKYSNRDGNKEANNLRSKLTRSFAFAFKKKLASDKEADNFFTYLNTALSRSTLCDGSNVKPYLGGGGYYTHIMTANSFSNIKNERQKLKTIQTSILIIKGQCDNQKWAYTKEYLDIFSNLKLDIIENRGHDLLTPNSTQMINIVSQFLGRALVGGVNS